MKAVFAYILMYMSVFIVSLTNPDILAYNTFWAGMLFTIALIVPYWISVLLLNTINTECPLKECRNNCNDHKESE